MAKSRRLIELMMAVNRKTRFTVKELADEFSVSTRTMLRDLQELSGMGVPLYSQVGAGGGYQVLKELSLPPISFTENEALSIFFACHSLRHYNALPFEASSTAALRKFFAHLPDDTKNRIDEMRNRVDFYTPGRQQRTEYLEELLQASLEKVPVTIEYGTRVDQTRRRTIQPIGIYAQEGFWFCPAYCYLRNAYRLFRVDRMWSVKLVAAETLPTPVDVREVHLSNWGQHFHSELERVNVRVKLTEKGIELCQDKSWLFPWQKVQCPENGTDFFEATVPVSELSFVADYFFSYGAEAVVLEPEDLRKEVKDKLARALQEYT